MPEYTADGQVESDVDTPASGSTTTTAESYYDTGWLKSVSRSGAESYSIGYQYDPDGSTTNLTYPDGSTTAYAYDGQGDIDTATFTSTGSSDPVPGLKFTYSYDDNGDVTKLAASAQSGFTAASTSTTYDSVNDVTALSTALSSSTLKFAYSSYDADGNVGEEAVSGPVSGKTYYSFNDVDEVIDEGSTSPPANEFGYDASGFETKRMTSDQQNFDDAGELTSSSGGTTSYSYNDAGDPATSTDQPTSSAYCPGETGSSCPYSSINSSYGWTPGGELSSATLTGVSGSTQTTAVAESFTYDGAGVRETSTIGSQTTDYAYDPSTSVPRLLNDGTFDFVYGSSDVPIAQLNTTTGEVDLLVQDALGNVRGVVALNTSAQGTLVNYTTYDAYGRPAEAGGLTVPQTTVKSTYTGWTPFGFGGGYTDPTGLVYLVHRYYDAETGQFLSVDPLDFVTQAGYTYAEDDPLDGTDPSGLLVCERVDSETVCRTPQNSVAPGENGTPWTQAQMGYGVTQQSGEGLGTYLSEERVAESAYLAAVDRVQHEQAAAEAQWARQADALRSAQSSGLSLGGIFSGAVRGVADGVALGTDALGEASDHIHDELISHFDDVSEGCEEVGSLAPQVAVPVTFFTDLAQGDGVAYSAGDAFGSALGGAIGFGVGSFLGGGDENGAGLFIGFIGAGIGAKVVGENLGNFAQSIAG